MTTRNIATSTLWQVGSQAIAMILGVASVKLVTTVLSRELVGNYQTVYSYLQIFGILADFGLYAVSVRELSRTSDRSGTFATLFVLRACITILSLLGAISIIWLVPGFRDTPLPLGVTIAAFVPFFTLLGGMLRSLFQVEYRLHYVFIAEVVGKLIPVCLMFAIALTGVRQTEQTDYYYLFILFGALGSLLFFIMSLSFARSLSSFGIRLPSLCQSVYHGFSRHEFARIAKIAFPFGLAYLCTTIYRQSDVTLIALLRPYDYDLQNAYYGIVMRITEMAFLLPTFLLNSVLPVLSAKEEGSDDAFVRQSLLLGHVLLTLLILGSVVSLFAFFWAKPLVLLLANSTYLSSPVSHGSNTALQILSFPIFLSGIVSFCFYLLLMIHAWRMLLLIVGAAALVSIALNLLLIPPLGFVGAGITSTIVHLLLATSLSALTVKKVPVYLPFSKFVRFACFAISLSALLYLTSPLIHGEILTLLGGGIGVFVVFALLKIFGLMPESLWRLSSGREILETL